MRIDPLDFPQARTAPPEVVRRLEELDPSACLVHLGGPIWLVGKVRPNAHARAEAEAMFANWHKHVSEGKRMSTRGQARVRFAMLAMLGVRPVQQYRIQGEPDGRIVRHFEQSRFRWLHTSDNTMQHEIDTAGDAQRDAARADIGSIDRAKDAWKHAFTLSHTTSVSQTPVDRPKAGWQRHGPSGPALHT